EGGRSQRQGGQPAAGSEPAGHIRDDPGARFADRGRIVYQKLCAVATSQPRLSSPGAACDAALSARIQVSKAGSDRPFFSGSPPANKGAPGRTVGGRLVEHSDERLEFQRKL